MGTNDLFGTGIETAWREAKHGRMGPLLGGMPALSQTRRVPQGILEPTKILSAQGLGRRRETGGPVTGIRSVAEQKRNRRL